MRFDYKFKYLGIILILISGYFFLYYFPDTIKCHDLCPFKIITGIPCPACGSVRVTMLLFKGEFWESVLVNPLGIVTNILILVSIIWMSVDLLKGKETYVPFLKKDWPVKVKVFFGIILLINWIWNIEKGI